MIVIIIQGAAAEHRAQAHERHRRAQDLLARHTQASFCLFEQLYEVYIVYVYIYIYRERDVHIHTYVCIYIYIYI